MSDYRFDIPYSILFGGFSNDYRIDILPQQDDTPRIGDILTYVLDYWIDPDVIPLTATPVTSIEWIDYNGNILGTNSTLTYTPTEPGWCSIQVTVKLEDVSDDFEYIISEGYTFDLKALIPISNTFNLTHLSENTSILYSNMDIYRYLTYFPKWSSSYVNFFSNSSKLISPQLDRISVMMDTLDEILANNNPANENVPFGYKEEWIRILTVNVPDYIKTEYGYLSNLGSVSTASIDNMVIQNIDKKTSHNIQKVSENIFGGKHRITLRTPSTLYIKSLSFPKSKNKKVVLNGVSSDGEFITESVVLDISGSVQTVNKYFIVSRVACEDIEINISNYIEDDISYTDKSLLEKRMVNRDGVYFTPIFSVDGRILLINNGDKVSINEEFKFELPFEVDTILINNLLDVIMLKDNVVYSSKLMLDYRGISSPGSSVNNNSYIVVDDENAEIGSSVNVSINTELLKAQSNASHIKVSILNEGVKEYLLSNGTLTTDKDTWLELGKTGDRIILSVNISNSNTYVFELEENTRKESFYAMIYQNKIIETVIGYDVDNIFFHNSKLYFQETNLDTFLIDPIRMGFISEGRYSYIQHDFNQTELVYND